MVTKNNNQQINQFTGGMNTDLSYNIIEQTNYILAKNLRIASLPRANNTIDNNQYGQLGNNTQNSSSIPIKITNSDGTDFVKITYAILQSDKINAIKALNKTNILDDYYVHSEMVVKSPDSGKNELMFEWNDASNLYIDRVFETPRFLIDFDVFNIGEKTSTKTISESDEIQPQEVQEDSEINLTSEESQIIVDFINNPTDDIDQDLLQKYINSIQNDPDKKEEISNAIVEAQGNLSDYTNLC